MRHTTPMHPTILAALALTLGLACAGPAPAPAPAPVADPTPINEPVPVPEPVTLVEVEPAPMPQGRQWMPVDGFPGLEIGGSFAHDVGMMWEGVRFDGRYYPHDRMAPIALAAAGWATADETTKQQIAERFCRGLLHWDVVWNIAHTPWEPSEAGRFSPAGATVRDGAIVFTAWSDETFVGMRPPVATQYRKFEAVFALDGTVTVTELDTYDAPRRRS